MAKKTRTELSTLAINTNLPDNTTELITPTTERAQLTDERESVVNYKDDLGGVPNAGKFLTVAVDGESLTMVDAPTGDVTGSGVQYQVAVWDGTNSLTGNAAFQFLTGAQNSIKLIRGTGSGNILFYAADGTTLHGYIENQVSGNGLVIGQRDGLTSAVIDLDDSTITFKTNNNPHLTISSTGAATFSGDVLINNTNNNPRIELKQSGTTAGYFAISSGANSIVNGSVSGDITFRAVNKSVLFSVDNGASSALTISNGGNVGIGIAPSPQNLIAGSLDLNGGASIFGYNKRAYLASNVYYQGGWKVKEAGYGAFMLAGLTNGDFGFYTTTEGATDNATVTDSRSLHIASDGVVSIPNGVVFNNNSTGGTPNATGVTLNDYEEGTYTATVTISDAASGTITLSTSYNTLTYTRIGRVVTITGYCYVASVSGSPTGTISINLPFNQGSGETFYSAASVEFNNVVSSALNEFWCQVVPNSIQIYRSTGTSVSATTAQQMQTGTDFRVCATYFI